MTGSAAPFDRATLIGLFDEMSQELAARTEHAELFIVGGAAMALAYTPGRITLDVDAAFEPAPLVREVARQVAERHNLAEDWLNDAAKAFLAGNDPDARTVYESASLIVKVASPRYLLAMKLLSGRAGRDIDDAVALYNIAGYTTVEEGLALLEDTYPIWLLKPAHRFLTIEVAARAAAKRAVGSDEPEPFTAPTAEVSCPLPDPTGPAPQPPPSTDWT